MAQTFCTGPVHIGLGWGGLLATPTGTPSTTRYFGTTREGPDITEEPSYFPIMNDLAGPNIPLDRGFAGSEDLIALVMTRWDPTTDAALDTRGSPALPTIAPSGSEVVGNRGSLVSNGLGVQLILQASTTNSPLAWRRYFQTMNVGPNKPIWGNKENVRIRVFRAQNVFTGVTPGANGFRLYDQGAVGVSLPWGFTVT